VRRFERRGCGFESCQEFQEFNNKFSPHNQAQASPACAYLRK
jgi:hypothetical protein